MPKEIVLICTPLRFYTHDDEELCFQWIEKISCIEEYFGVGRELHLHIVSKNISTNDLLNLMGLFARYKFDTKQLTVFMNDQNNELFDE
jgi:hypothetical protein